MDERTRDIIDYTVLAVSAAGMVMAVVGEALGWWGALGIILTVVFGLAGIASLFDAHGRRAVSLLDAWGGAIRALHGKQDQMLGKQDQMLELQARSLTLSEAMLAKQDATIAVLDRIQETLDARLPDGV